MKTISYHQLVFSACLAIFMLGFTFPMNAQNETLDYSTADKDLKIAKATVKAYEDQNWNTLRDYLSEDATIFGLASFDSLNVDQTIAYWTKGSDTAHPELENESWLAVSIKEGPNKGNWVYHWGDNTLSYSSGERISFPYHLALKIKGEKVEEAHFYYDNYKIIRELGYAISPPLEEGEPAEEVLEVNFEEPADKN